MTSSAYISVSSDGRVSVNIRGFSKFLKRIDGVWSTGTFSVMDEETNFELVPVGTKEFETLLHEAKTFGKSLPKSAE